MKQLGKICLKNTFNKAFFCFFDKKLDIYSVMLLGTPCQYLFGPPFLFIQALTHCDVDSKMCWKRSFTLIRVFIDCISMIQISYST